MYRGPGGDFGLFSLMLILSSRRQQAAIERIVWFIGDGSCTERLHQTSSRRGHELSAAPVRWVQLDICQHYCHPMSRMLVPCNACNHVQAPHLMQITAGVSEMMTKQIRAMRGKQYPLPECCECSGPNPPTWRSLQQLSSTFPSQCCPDQQPDP